MRRFVRHLISPQTNHLTFAADHELDGLRSLKVMLTEMSRRSHADDYKNS